MKLAKTLVLALIATGCSTEVYNGIPSPERNFAVAKSFPYGPPKTSVGKPKSLDELVRSIKSLDESIDNRKRKDKYSVAMKGVMEDVKNKKFGDVSQKVQKLCKILEAEKDAYSRQILRGVKKFTYDRFDYVGPSYSIDKKASPNLFYHAFSLALYPLMPHSASAECDGTKIKVQTLWPAVRLECERIKEEYYIQVRVNPYSGTEQVIGEVQVGTVR